ncbi:MAG TPA: hypothetical protein ENH40_00975, partial [Nitrospirae bacterium]|nr:hypothetical protein [Nitrospirota bacterium]
MAVCLIDPYYCFWIVHGFFNHTAVFDTIIDDRYEPIFWGNTDISDSAKLFQQWVYGVWGATMAGWGIITAFIVQYPFRKKEKWAWSGLVIMLLVWFVLDTSISLIYRVYI